MMKIKPLNKNVLVKISAPKEVAVGGIILPEKTKEALRRNCQGVVVAMGEGIQYQVGSAGEGVEVGDIVMFDEWSGTEVKDPDSKDDEVIYKLVPYSNLLAIL